MANGCWLSFDIFYDAELETQPLTLPTQLLDSSFFLTTQSVLEGEQ